MYESSRQHEFEKLKASPYEPSESAVQDLGFFIERFTGSEKEQVAELEESSGIPKKTLWRLMESVTGSPSITTVVPLLPIITSESEAKAYLKAFFPKFYEWKYAGIDENRVFDSSSEELLADNFIFFAVDLICSGEGATRIDCERHLGPAASKAIDEMVRCGMLTESANGFYKSSDYHVNRNSSQLAILSHMTRLFNPSHIGTNVFGSGVHWNKRNEQGINEISQAFQEFRDKATQIMNNSSYSGNIPCFVGLIFDCLDNKKGGENE